MKRLLESGSKRGVVVLAVVLLGLGLLVDLGYTQQQLRVVRRLTAERDRVRTEFQRVQSESMQSGRLTAYFGGEGVGQALRNLSRSDPVSYLGEAVRTAGLVRDELSTESSAETGKLRCTRCFLRVHGGYQQVLGYVRSLEQGARLVSVDALVIQVLDESGQVEARLDLAVYDPLIEIP